MLEQGSKNCTSQPSQEYVTLQWTSRNGGGKDYLSVPLADALYLLKEAKTDVTLAINCSTTLSKVVQQISRSRDLLTTIVPEGSKCWLLYTTKLTSPVRPTQ